MTEDNKRKVLVCIPAFNEEKTIGGIVKACRRHATEVVVYDDGSGDNTQEAAEIAGALVLRNSTNRGYGFAIKSIFQYAKTSQADILVTIDGDGQHNPDQMPEILEPLFTRQADLVIGSRFLTEDDRQRIPKYRSMGIRTITRLTQVASYKGITDAQSGFRAYNRKAISQIELFEDGMAVSTEILLRAKERGLEIKETPITIKYDVEDSSSHNPLSHGIGVLYKVFQFISLRHPFWFYGLPGIILLGVSAYFTNNALELYSSTRYISTNLILVSLGIAIVGVVLFATGAILYTITALLKGKLRDPL
jgi:glycosyltransferase involved in cell wall biosynthesis